MAGLDGPAIPPRWPDVFVGRNRGREPRFDLGERSTPGEAARRRRTSESVVTVIWRAYAGARVTASGVPGRARP
jgi:hypothetical protein